MTTLTDAEREALMGALRSCRVEDGAPVALIHEGDIYHVTHMVGQAVERIVAAREAEVLRDYADLCAERVAHMDGRLRETTADGRERNVWGLAEHELRARADRIGGQR